MQAPESKYSVDMFMYVPAAHATHGPPSGPSKPALHIHSDSRMLPARLAELESQDRHASLPETFLYVLDAHSTQSTPENPRLHKQPVNDVLPYGDVKPLFRQESHTVSPSKALYLPAVQITHPPSKLEYPGLHTQSEIVEFGPAVSLFVPQEISGLAVTTPTALPSPLL